MKLKSIQILTDENISPKVVKSLRDQGLDVLDIKEEGWYGKEDKDILDIAFREKRFILSHDSDFGTLAINEEKRFFGILYLRLNDLKPENVARVCIKLFGQDLDIFPGAIVVIEETRIRMRSREVEPI
jgi:predicted nuclease of predicted toxin-antitoxin system